jgi:acetoin utilization deacetylase AcuC-like enzyme
MPSEPKSSPVLKTINKLGISVPFAELLPLIKGMPAACDGGQVERLGWALAKLQQLPQESLTPTGCINIFSPNQLDRSVPKYISPQNYTIWHKIFTLIKASDKNITEKLDAINNLINKLEINKDILALALIKTHSKEYITKVIHACCQAQEKNTATTIGIMPMDMTEEEYKNEPSCSDLVVTGATFEFIISELIASIENRHKIQLSINLPSHHATAEMGSGFCVFNSMAIISATDEMIAAQHGKEITKIIVGIDVNHDDGLSDIWWHDDSNHYYKHIDIFDSRVFPLYQDCNLTEHLAGHLLLATDEKRKTRIETIYSEIPEQWIQYKLDGNNYTAVNLKYMQRMPYATPDNPNNIHPALIFTIAQIKTELTKSKSESRQAVIYIPMGWDSHVNEQAGCSGFRKVKQSHSSYHKDRIKSRFTHQDMEFFYRQIANLLINPNYKDIIESVFFTLEGGYTKQVNDQQLQLFLNIFSKLQPKKRQSFASSRDKTQSRYLPAAKRAQADTALPQGPTLQQRKSSYTHLYSHHQHSYTETASMLDTETIEDTVLITALEKLRSHYKT